MNSLTKGKAKRSIAKLLASLTAVAMFPLIFVGAGVTTKGAGMAFADWPTSDGVYINPKGWLQDSDKRWEHSHRLIGWTVGMLAIGSVVASWRGATKARILTIFTLLAIVVQGVMGGVRVREISQGWAMIHAIWGQLTFALAIVTVLLAGEPSGQPERIAVPGARVYRNGAIVATVAVALQLVLGAWYRHFASSGALLGHVLWALVVFMVLSWLTMWTLEQYPRLQPLGFLGKSMAVLIALQMVLGGAAFLIRVMGGNWPDWIATMAPSAHVAVGALMLACSGLMAVGGYLRLIPAESAVVRTSAAAVVR